MKINLKITGQFLDQFESGIEKSQVDQANVLSMKKIQRYK